MGNLSSKEYRKTLSAKLKSDSFLEEMTKKLKLKIDRINQGNRLPKNARPKAMLRENNKYQKSALIYKSLVLDYLKDPTCIDKLAKKYKISNDLSYSILRDPGVQDFIDAFYEFKAEAIREQIVNLSMKSLDILEKYLDGDIYDGLDVDDLSKSKGNKFFYIKKKMRKHHDEKKNYEEFELVPRNLIKDPVQTALQASGIVNRKQMSDEAREVIDVSQRDGFKLEEEVDHVMKEETAKITESGD